MDICSELITDRRLVVKVYHVSREIDLQEHGFVNLGKKGIGIVYDSKHGANCFVAISFYLDRVFEYCCVCFVSRPIGAVKAAC